MHLHPQKDENCSSLPRFEQVRAACLQNPRNPFRLRKRHRSPKRRKWRSAMRAMVPKLQPGSLRAMVDWWIGGLVVVFSPCQRVAGICHLPRGSRHRHLAVIDSSHSSEPSSRANAEQPAGHTQTGRGASFSLHELNTSNTSNLRRGLSLLSPRTMDISGNDLYRFFQPYHGSVAHVTPI